MINEPIKHDKHHMPAASAGGENAYYLKGCEAVQRSPSYAACLYKLSEIEAGRESVMHADCATACRQKKCLAAEMREQERLQGVALYYFPRKPPQAITLPFKAAGDFGVRITNLTDPALIPRDPGAAKDRFVAAKPATPLEALDQELDAGSGYAAAINAAVAEPAPEPKPVPVVVTHTPSGKSVLIERFEAAQERAAAPTARPAMQVGETPLQYARRIAQARQTTHI